MAHGGSLGELRAANLALVIAIIEQAGSLSRADLMRRTGLSRSTVSSLVVQLIEQGVLVERLDRGTPYKGRSGRPPILLELATLTGVVAGIDVGHRHVRVALARPDSTIVLERSVILDVDDSPRESMDRVATLLDELLAESGHQREDVRGSGLGIPGPVDSDGRMTSGILPTWRGLRPADELAERTGLVARVHNDAHLGARGELAYGAARGHRDVIYVKASTGVGAGLIVDGHLVTGTTGIAGELGHVQVDVNGVMCRCGSRGCLETEVSGPKLVALLQPAYDERLTVPRVLELAQAGDAGATRALNDFGRRIGRVLANIANMLNPEQVVVGGGFGSAPALQAGVRDALDRYAQPATAAAITVLGGALGERAEVMGAIAVALDPPDAPRSGRQVSRSPVAG
ncbi:ROK family transcriptional regulator [Nocardioides sp.]|uniref:ROK family transcriptional regulator n=1 Tax=Nocardioides sp. TaxID=35761 RepID=UPI00261A93A7|nr:ROK family transcriptional regulator [Nocardioides sp.]MDI6911565.1 ROK family transcriptional regulator [Nocardioides sp.]